MKLYVDKYRENKFITSGLLAYSSPGTNLQPKFDWFGNDIQWSVNLHTCSIHRCLGPTSHLASPGRLGSRQKKEAGENNL